MKIYNIHEWIVLAIIFFLIGFVIWLWLHNKRLLKRLEKMPRGKLRKKYKNRLKIRLRKLSKDELVNVCYDLTAELIKQSIELKLTKIKRVV